MRARAKQGGIVVAAFAIACATDPAIPATDRSPPIDPPASGFQVLGPSAVYAWHIAYAPDDPSTLYLGLDDGGGVWRSDDGGGSFALASGELSDVLAWAFAIDAGNPERLYAGDGHGRGVFLSRDRGQTWSFSSAGLASYEDREVFSLAVDPGDPDTVWAGTAGGLRVSNDAGESWQAVAGELEASSVLEVLATPGAAGTELFVATGRQDDTDPDAPSRVFRSTDRGASFDDLTPAIAAAGAAVNDDGLTATVTDLAIDSRDRLLLVTGVDPDGQPGVLLRSSAERTAFSRLPLEVGGLFPAIALPAGAPDVIYVTGGIELDPAIQVSVDDGASFEGRGDLAAEAVLPMSLAVDPATPDHVWMGTFSELMESNDGGTTWANVSAGLNHSCGTAVAVTEVDGERVVYAGLVDHASLLPRRNAFRLERELWRELPIPSDVFAIAAAAPDRVVVGSFNRGAFVSGDGGKSFDHARGIPREEFTVFGVFVTADGDILAGGFGPTEQGLYLSSDGGQSFTRREGVDFVPVNFAQKGRVIVAASLGGVGRSEDGGATWELVFETDDDLRAILIADDAGDEILLGDGKGLIRRSVDGGRTFEPRFEGFVGRAEINRLLIDPRDGSLLAGLASANVFVRSVERDSGLWRSTDGGASFGLVARARPSSHIYDMVWDPATPGRLYTAMWCSGIQVIDLPADGS